MRVVFPATVEVDEFETGTASNGRPFLAMRDAEVTTAYEVVQRTVMAFGDECAVLAADLAAGRPIAVDLHESGATMTVDAVRRAA